MRNETEGPDAEAFVPVRGFKLRVVAGADENLRHAARSERTLVGTDEVADVRLSDPTVSRKHCEIVLSGGRVIARDLNSRNGTFVNGVSIVAVYLTQGCVIRVGRTELSFDSDVRAPTIAERMPDRFGLLVGKSRVMLDLFRVLEQTASSDVTVLIQGETGTGKDLAARSIHDTSTRADGPWMVVDCGAISPNLLESELFGHEKGSFTGADKPRAGVFESASGGTIFLDEIGELPLDLQPKLLRVLEQREVRRVGATNVTPVDVRIIAATNRDLASEVKAGRFRQDLYYRLTVTEVVMPPLRERKEDLPLLVRAILDQLGATTAGQALFEVPEFMVDLYKHQWPGNGRELRNYLERCVALQQYVAPTLLTQADQEIDENPIDINVPLKELRERWVEKFEKQYLAEVLRAHGNNVTRAAAAAGMNRAHFHRLLARHGLRGS